MAQKPGPNRSICSEFEHFSAALRLKTTRVFSLKTAIRFFSSNFFHLECHRVVTGGKFFLQTNSQTLIFNVNEKILSPK
jgi:hypothetical protein